MIHSLFNNIPCRKFALVWNPENQSIHLCYAPIPFQEFPQMLRHEFHQTKTIRIIRSSTAHWRDAPPDLRDVWGKQIPHPYGITSRPARFKLNDPNQIFPVWYRLPEVDCRIFPVPGPSSHTLTAATSLIKLHPDIGDNIASPGCDCVCICVALRTRWWKRILREICISCNHFRRWVDVGFMSDQSKTHAVCHVWNV